MPEPVIKKTSWKTTLFGALAAIGTYLATIHDPAWISTVGTILVGLSTALLGFSARDNGVSSEDVGAK